MRSLQITRLPMTKLFTFISLLFCLSILPSSETPAQETEARRQKDPSQSKQDQSAAQNFSAKDVAAAQQMADSLGVAEWLGPLAPLALSPFFGVTCLSGMSLFGGSWISEGNPFLGSASPLNDPWVFGCFLVLTVVTSIPRLFKVSKPFVQMTDRLESWAGISTMLVLKFLVSGGDVDDAGATQVVQLGVFSFTTDVLLMIAAALNVLVISSVRFFCEMMIWIIPIPTIDALFEAANKSVCGLLMLIYGYSPTLATALNLGLFVVCAVIFRWVYRQEYYFRTVLLDAACQKLFPAKAVDANGLMIFPSEEFEGVPRRAKCLLVKTDVGWQVVHQRLFRSPVVRDLSGSDWRLILRDSFLQSDLVCETEGRQHAFVVTRKYHHVREELCECYGLQAHEDQADSKDKNFQIQPELL